MLGEGLFDLFPIFLVRIPGSSHSGVAFILMANQCFGPFDVRCFNDILLKVRQAPIQSVAAFAKALHHVVEISPETGPCSHRHLDFLRREILGQGVVDLLADLQGEQRALGVGAF